MARLGGLLAIAIGLGAGWFFLVQPLHQAMGGAPEVSYSLRAFLLVPLCLVFGLAFLVLGANFKYRTDDHKNFTLLGWLLFGLVVVLTGLGYWWFDQQFAALGYT